MQPNLLMILPFVLLLALIAIGPLWMPAWWGKHYPKLSFGLAAVVIAYYLFGLGSAHRVGEVAKDYVRFIIFIGALFVVSGGIHLNVKGQATPWENVRFLSIGALIANLIGTTGASILLVRPWLRMNKYRVTAHHVVFFIFLVSNVGGCLTPIGDPPLYLGYLKGIPFWWIAEHAWPVWLIAVSVLLALFLIVDTKNYRNVPQAVREKLAEPPDKFRFEGLLNLLYLGLILGAAFIENPVFLREAIMLVAATASYFTTSRTVHLQNDFNFHPIREVAILFFGIFATMLPALDWLQFNGSKLALSPALLFFGSGTLSSVLDNAPTYLTFLTAITGSVADSPVIAQVQQILHSGAGPHLFGSQEVRQTLAALHKYFSPEIATGKITIEQIQICYLIGNSTFSKYILAISAGSVFFGANTYIGNGPNFMVKAIADQNKVHTPSFFGYIFRFTFPFMMPMLLVVWFIFFRATN